METKKRLLQDFRPSGYDDWKSAATASLKGKPIEKLIVKSYEGIDVKPIYNQQDIDPSHSSGLPGSSPYLRGTKSSGYKIDPLKIGQYVSYPDPKEMNQFLRDALSKGLDSVDIHLDQLSSLGADYASAEHLAGLEGTSVYSVQDLETIFEAVDLTRKNVYFHNVRFPVVFASLLTAYFRKAGIDTNPIQGGIAFDPLGMLAETGALPYSAETAFNAAASLIRHAGKHLPRFKCLRIDGNVYHNAGGNAVQELAFSFSAALEYIRNLIDRDLDINEIATKIEFGFAIGSDFFTEIAKLRAARLIWAKLMEAFATDTDSSRMKIIARTGATNKTALDEYTNMLRTTGEGLAAIIGACDELIINPYNSESTAFDPLALRYARNQAVVLREECNLQDVADPAGGSYYLESLTKEIASKAWELFQETEEQGGFCSALMNNFIQESLSQSALKKRSNLSTRKDVLIGVNKSPNLKDNLNCAENNASEEFAVQRLRIIEQRIKNRDNANLNKIIGDLSNETDSDKIFAGIISAASLGANMNELVSSMCTCVLEDNRVNPIEHYRAAEVFEKLRANSSAYHNIHGDYPKVYLANYGELRQFKARADFASDFLQVGGFSVIYPAGKVNLNEISQDIASSNVKALVLCSSDDVYPEFVPQLTKLIKETNPGLKVLLAGYPPDHTELFRSSGVDDFIHVRANIFDVLNNLQKHCGVKGE